MHADFVNNPDEQLASSSRYMVDLYLNSKRQVLLAVMSSLKINSQKHSYQNMKALSGVRAPARNSG